MKKFVSIIVFALSLILIFSLISLAKGTYEIHYGTWANPGEAAYEGMEQFKKIVEEASNGQIEVFLYPANQLGSTDEQVEQVGMGTIQMMSSGQPGMKEIEYMSLPYLMKSIANWEKVINSDIGQEWNKTLVSDRGMRMLGFLPRGPRVISCNKIVNSIDDLAGMKIRSPERDYYVETLTAFGAKPTPMAFGEVYTALQTGVVDGQENPVETIYAAGFYEVQKCIALTYHIVKPAFVLINEEFFQNLPEDFQSLLMEAQSKSRIYAQEILDKQQMEMLQEMENKGIVITKPDLAPFIKVTEPVREKLGKKVWGEDVYNYIKAIGQE